MAKRKSTKSAGRKSSGPGSGGKGHSGGASGRRSSTSSRGRSSSPIPPPETGPQRLQRVMAAAGFGSRRECEEYILEGRVDVDGKTVKTLGTKVDPEKQKIVFDGQKLVLAAKKYFILNKPQGVVSTSSDPAGRLRVIDLIKSNQRVYNVGRLDKSSEGLILVTNDGDLANRLTHPRYGVAKTYLVQVKGRPEKEDLESLKRGIYLAEGFAKVANITFKRKSKDTSWLQIILEEGRNREIRRLLAKIGHKVIRLQRVAIGPVELGELPIGAHRRLTREELESLQRAVAGEGVKRTRPAKKAVRKKPSGSRTAYSSGAKAHSGSRSSSSSRASSSREKPAAAKSKETSTRTSRSSSSKPKGSSSSKPKGSEVWKTAKPRKRKSSASESASTSGNKKSTGSKRSGSAPKRGAAKSGSSKRGAGRAGGLKKLGRTKKRGRK